MQYAIFEDAGYRSFGPLTVLRPTFDLMCGALLLREKLEIRRPGQPCALVPRSGLAELVAEACPGRGADALTDEPAIFLWEDVHWIDASSESLLFADEQEAEPHGTLGVLTFRPEYRPLKSSGVAYLQIPLRPLEPASMRELLTDLLGSDLAAGPLAQAIQERAAGNPFFVEEIVQSLVEFGVLRGTRGAYELAGAVEAIAIPDSVQAVLAARIDRLGEHEKTVLQTASIIGRSFVLHLLAGLSGAPEHELDTILRRLIEAEFVYEEAIYPEAEYAFRHPLTQEVAYDSQLGERRRGLHTRLVDLLREHHRDRLDENAALLAHHLEQAGRLADAAAWHARAAEWVERRDVAEGLRHWRRVIEIEDGLPQPERDGELHARAYAGTLHLCWRMSLSRDETRELLKRGLAVADRIGSPRLRAKMLIPYAVICGMCGDERERIRWSREALDLARSQGDRELELSARVPLVSALVLVGPLQEALDVIDEGLGASSPALSRAMIEDASMGTSLMRMILSPSRAPLFWIKSVRDTSPSICPTTIGRSNPTVISVCPPQKTIPSLSQALEIWLKMPSVSAFVATLSGNRIAASVRRLNSSHSPQPASSATGTPTENRARSATW